MFRYFILLNLLILVTATSFCQTGDIKIGTSARNLTNFGGYYDYSDPSSVNINVSVWGNVRFPGKYSVPESVSVRDLLSYAGGPTMDAELDDLRLYRIMPDSTQSMLKFSYNDLLWKDHLSNKKSIVPPLSASDVLLVPGEPRLYYRDYFTMTLSVVGTLISLAILVINIARK